MTHHHARLIVVAIAAVSFSTPITAQQEPQRPKAEYPWFWGWDEPTEDFTGVTKFDGNRWNDCHYTNGAKQAAREAAKKGGKV